MIYDGITKPLKSFGIGAKEIVKRRKRKRKGKGDNNEHH